MVTDVAVCNLQFSRYADPGRWLSKPLGRDNEGYGTQKDYGDNRCQADFRVIGMTHLMPASRVPGYLTLHQVRTPFRG